jgi:hypothetical protein
MVALIGVTIMVGGAVADGHLIYLAIFSPSAWRS